MTDIEFDERARQRVMDFLALHADTRPLADANAQNDCGVAVAEALASIAQQTAADLIQFLRGGKKLTHDLRRFAPS